MKFSICSFARSARIVRRAAIAVVASQVISTTPLVAETITERAYSTAVFSTTQAMSLYDKGAETARRLKTRLDVRLGDVQAQMVRVNRTRPQVEPPSHATTFSADPTTRELREARIFAEPLVPDGGDPTQDETTGLARALEAFIASGMRENVSALTAYLDAHPTSPWRASLLANIGLIYQRDYYSRASAAWQQAWELAKASEDPAARAVADYAVGEWLELAVQFGQVERLQDRLAELDARDVRGPAAASVTAAREGVAFLTNFHDDAVFSGPEALKALLTASGRGDAQVLAQISAYRSPHRGTSVADLRRLAASAGMPLRAVHALPLREIPVPSILHLRSEHFTALVERRGNQILARDPILGGEVWFSEAALRDEGSGYILVPESQPVGGWRTVPDGEAAGVIGRCAPGGGSGDDPCGCNGGSPPGMPTYAFHPVSAALVINDNPLGYAPAYGPDVRLRLAYNHRDARAPQTFSYGNVGPLWTWDWMAFVTDNNSSVAAPYSWQTVALRGEGKEQYSLTDASPTHFFSGAQLVKVTDSPIRYERRLPDGTVEVYTLADRAATLPNRRIFLTQVIDPQGHGVTYTYDSSPPVGGRDRRPRPGDDARLRAQRSAEADQGHGSVWPHCDNDV